MGWREIRVGLRLKFLPTPLQQLQMVTLPDQPKLKMSVIVKQCILILTLIQNKNKQLSVIIILQGMHFEQYFMMCLFNLSCCLLSTQLKLVSFLTLTQLHLYFLSSSVVLNL